MKKARIFSSMPITPLNIFLTPELKPFLQRDLFPFYKSKRDVVMDLSLKLISAAWNDPSKKKKLPLRVRNYQGL